MCKPTCTWARNIGYDVTQTQDTGVLSQLDAPEISAALASLADLQLSLDNEGVCLELRVTNPELTDLRRLSWQGKNWLDTVTPEQQARVQDALQRTLGHSGETRTIEVTHLWEGHTTLPIRYQLVGVSGKEQVIAIGQDLRGVTELRQQLLNAQQAMEQDYWSMRQMENRYRRLFDIATDGFLVVDDDSGRILEGNRRAATLLNSNKSIIGRPFPLGLEGEILDIINDLLSEARTSGKSRASNLKLTPESPAINAVVHFVRQGGDSRFLICLSTTAKTADADSSLPNSSFQEAPDAIIDVDDAGRIRASNATFTQWIQADSDEYVLGRMADNWLGRSGVDMSVLLSNLKQERIIRRFASVLRSDHGVATDIEISATRSEHNNQHHNVLFIRDIARRVTSENPITEQLPRSIEQITGRVGRVPLKELVRESTDVIEALCIEAALKLTGNNRASAAEMLGLSRQSLYTKLNRYGIGETGAE